MKQAYYPKKISEFVLKYLKNEYFKGTRFQHHTQGDLTQKDIRIFSEGALQLSQVFTRERSKIVKNYFKDPKLRSGYLLYFFPINFAKVSFVLRKMASKHLGQVRSVLDIGSGPGSAALSAALHCDQVSEFELIDQSAAALKDATQLLKAWKPELQVKTICCDLMQYRSHKKFDLILLSHVLNEISSDAKKIKFILNLVKNSLNPNGKICIIEPALQESGSALMRLRDGLLEQGIGIDSPCTHFASCPMLKTGRKDWCHFYVEWKEPSFLKQVDKILQNENTHLKCSYLILSQKQSHAAKYKARVVSNHMKTKGKAEVLACHRFGLARLIRLNKNQSEANSDFSRLKRGDLLDISSFGLSKYEVERRIEVDRQVKLKFWEKKNGA